jgi:peroxiredoxin
MLNSILSTLRRSRETAELSLAYGEFLQRLDAGRVAEAAVKPGDRMPEFLLPSAEGHLVASTELLVRGPLIVTFFRGAWCPYCAATLDALEGLLPELSRAGGILVAMTPETGGRALAMKRSHGLSYEVLVDVDLVVAMEFGIVFRTPPLYLDLLRRHGIDLSEISGNPGMLLPVPASFLIDRQGIIRRSWVDIDFTQRAEPTAILAALVALKLDQV